MIVQRIHVVDDVHKFISEHRCCCYGGAGSPLPKLKPLGQNGIGAATHLYSLYVLYVSLGLWLGLGLALELYRLMGYYLEGEGEGLSFLQESLSLRCLCISPKHKVCGVMINTTAT